MTRQITPALVIGLVLCLLVLFQNAGSVRGAGLRVNPRLYIGYGAPTTVQIYPTDDAYVSSEEPDSNFGVSIYLSCSADPDVRSFLKFDLSLIPSDVQVQSATLKLLCYGDGGSGASMGVRVVTNDAWSEGTITWNNQPPYGNLLDTVTESFYVNGVQVDKWWEWNVTTWVRSELSGDKIASFSLKSVENSCYFLAKEHGENIPYLEVTYTTPEPGKSPTTLTVSPTDFTITSGQGTILTATLTSDGSPLAGKTITWFKTAGTLSAGEGTTKSSGQVSVTYTAPTVENQTLVTITASFAGDDQYQSSSEGASGTITVALDADNDGLPDDWEITYFDNLDQGPDDDPDGDDYTNLQEYRLGTNPSDATSHPEAPENEEGEEVPAVEGFPSLVLIAVVAVVVIGSVGALVWIRSRRGKKGWAPKEEWE